MLTKLIRGKEKAIAAFVVAAVATYVAKHGLTFPTNWRFDAQAALAGVLAHLAVYFTGNK